MWKRGNRSKGRVGSGKKIVKKWLKIEKKKMKNG